MHNFNYYTPTKIVFGKETEYEVGKLIKEQKCQKVLIHYGGGSVIKSGLLNRVKESLTKENISFVELGGVVPNPRLSLVYEGISLCQKENVDFILAVGGGSVIDSSKAIGYGVTNDGDVWDFYDYKRTPKSCLPIGVILTISAAGSEMSNSSVITNDNGNIKRGYSNDYSRPKFAIMNPELTMTLPPYQTSCGIVDILMHTMERYFTKNGTMELTDHLSEALLKSVMNYGKKLMENPLDYQARAEIMWAGSLSHNGLMGCGTLDNGDWSTHKLEHELSGMYDVAHGAGLSAIWSSWAKYVYKDCKERFLKFAINVMEIPYIKDDDTTIILGIEKMTNYYKSINMPTNIKELGITPTAEELIVMSKKCSKAVNGTCGSIKKLKEQDMLTIYKNALK
ncbi:MAG: iron-containing alcohol dehydrogenase [Candidatus Coprovivens sp.]